MSKVSKFTMIGFIILLGVSATIFMMVYKDSEAKYNDLKSRYQMKNDSGFMYILKNTVSLIPLAETLEAISNTAKDESPAKVQQLIEAANIEADQIDEQMWTLIEFSDDYSENRDPEIVVNSAVMTSDEQYDMYTAFSGTWGSVRTISYRYWKARPKAIDEGTREYLRSLAGELRSMDETIAILKEEYTASIIFSYDVERAKAHLLGLIKPHLIKIDKLQEVFYSNAENF